MGKGKADFLMPEKEFKGTNPDTAMLRRLCGGGMGTGDRDLLSVDEIIQIGYVNAKDMNWAIEIYERFFRVWALARSSESMHLEQKSKFEAEIAEQQAKLDAVNKKLADSKENQKK